MIRDPYSGRFAITPTTKNQNEPQNESVPKVFDTLLDPFTEGLLAEMPTPTLPSTAAQPNAVATITKNVPESKQQSKSTNAFWPAIGAAVGTALVATILVVAGLGLGKHQTVKPKNVTRMEASRVRRIV